MTDETEVVEEDSTALNEFEREHYELIKSLNVDVSEASNKYDSAKSKAKAAKEILEDLQARLSWSISEGPKKPDPQQTLPFADEEWRQVDIQTVLQSITDKQREKLEAAGIKTVGEFEHVRSCQHPDYPNGLASIKGVGEKSIDKWESDVVEWLAINARE